MNRDKLGEILLSRGIITQAQLSDALELQKLSNSRLGDIIIAKGFTTYLQLYSALAEHYNLPFIDLLQNPPDENLLLIKDMENYLNYRAVPWRRDGDKIIIALAEYSSKTKDWIAKKHGGNVEFVITSPLDIRRGVEQVFGVMLEEKSRLALWWKNPEMSARQTISPKTASFLYISLFIVIAICLLFPFDFIVFFTSFCSICYLATMFIKFLIFVEGTRGKTPANWEDLIKQLDEKTLPIYTILIPMYKEVESVPNVLKAMKELDYPAEKLDIKLILEMEDEKTYQAALAIDFWHNFEIIRVPESELRTKPKACNYAMRFANGEYIVVFDADDQPESTQLKKAIITFRSRPKNVACLQARLNYYKADYNYLTTFFALEYSALFDVTMLGLQRLSIPLPLGGTSNHFSLANLRSLGEWDPFNVTEDADLGVRIAALGMRTEMLDSITMEEAPCQIPAWIRQRSRWIKGYMQTWLVQMRSPIRLYKTIGARSFFGFQFFIGFSSFTFLTVPIIWLFAFASWLLPADISIAIAPDWLITLTFVNFIFYFTTQWLMTFYCLIFHMPITAKNLSAAVFYPFYLFLHSIASYKALTQLIVKPHYWEKTTHGALQQKKSINRLTQALEMGYKLRLFNIKDVPHESSKFAEIS